MEKVINEVKAERQRQNDKWGVQDRNAVEWIAILTEEVGEASKEAVDFYFANGDVDVNLPAGHNLQEKRLNDFRKELIQVAAVAVQAVECIDRNRKRINDAK